MVRAAQGEAPMLQVSGAVIDADGLRDVVKALLDADSVEERLQVPGLDARRADIVLGGALVLEQTFAALAIDEMIASDFALREGVLLDVLRRPTRRRSATCVISGRASPISPRSRPVSSSMRSMPPSSH